MKQAHESSDIHLSSVPGLRLPCRWVNICDDVDVVAFHAQNAQTHRTNRSWASLQVARDTLSSSFQQNLSIWNEIRKRRMRRWTNAKYSNVTSIESVVQSTTLLLLVLASHVNRSIHRSKEQDLESLEKGTEFQMRRKSCISGTASPLLGDLLSF